MLPPGDEATVFGIHRALAHSFRRAGETPARETVMSTDTSTTAGNKDTVRRLYAAFAEARPRSRWTRSWRRTSGRTACRPAAAPTPRG